MPNTTIMINPFNIIIEWARLETEAVIEGRVEKLGDPENYKRQVHRSFAQITASLDQQSKLASQQNSAIDMTFTIPENYQTAFENCTSRQLLGYVKRIQATIKPKCDDEKAKEIEAIKQKENTPQGCEDKQAHLVNQLAFLAHPHPKSFFTTLNDHLHTFRTDLEKMQNPDVTLRYSDIVENNALFSKTPLKEAEESAALKETKDHNEKLEKFISTWKEGRKDSSTTPGEEHCTSGKADTTPSLEKKKEAYLEQCQTYITTTPESFYMVQGLLDRFIEQTDLKNLISAHVEQLDSINGVSTIDIRQTFEGYIAEI